MSNDIVVSYAQNREDIILNAFFRDKKNGVYVDVGSNDPDEYSVTKFFYERGWSGINIEPSLTLFNRLQSQRKRDTNLNIGISNVEDTLDFREYEGRGLSTFSGARKSELSVSDIELAKQYKDYGVRVETLSKVLTEYAKDTHIDFMKIDVEGYEYEVIDGNDWGKFRPTVLCIEANHAQKDWRLLLEDNDYSKIFFDGLNDYYVDNMADAIEFRYIETVIGRSVISSEVNDNIKDMLKTIHDLNQRLQETKDEQKALKVENHEIRKLLRGYSRTRGSAKLFAKALDRAICVQLNKIDNGGTSTAEARLPSIDLVKLRNSSPEQALSIVRAWDSEVLPTDVGISFELKRSKRFRVVDTSYGITKKTIKKSAKTTYGFAKKIKGRK